MYIESIVILANIRRRNRGRIQNQKIKDVIAVNSLQNTSFAYICTAVDMDSIIYRPLHEVHHFCLDFYKLKMRFL